MRFKTSPKYGIGILGTNFGLKVIAPAVINSNHYNLVCVANSSPVMQQRFLPNSRILKLKKSDVLSSPDVDIVWVATPPETHLILVKEALNLGKIVICEKPCGNSTQDVTSLRSLSEELNLPIFVNFEFRYDPIYTHIFAAAKKIHRGHFIRFSVNWKTYAQVQKNKLVNHKNILLDFAIHVLDSFLDFANNIGALFISIEESINKCAICKTNSHLCKQLYLIFDSFSVDIVICRHYTGTGIHEVVMHSENIVINTGIVQPYTSNDFFYTNKSESHQITNRISRFSINSYFSDMRIYSIGLLLQDIANYLISGKSSKNPPDVLDAVRVHTLIENLPTFRS